LPKNNNLSYQTKVFKLLFFFAHEIKYIAKINYFLAVIQQRVTWATVNEKYVKLVAEKNTCCTLKHLMY
jgi:hypothetical protein